MKVKINKERCIGCMLCNYAVPEVFGMDEDNRAMTLVDPVPGELAEDCEETAADCRTGAVELTHDQDGA